MKLRSVLCVLAALLLLGSCFAETDAPFDADAFYGELEYEYIRYDDYGFPLEPLFLGIGAFDYASPYGEPWFNDSVLECLIAYQAEHGLPETGYFDFATLDMLPLPAAHEDFDTILDMDDVVWIPMHGGKKHHSDSDCSNMVYPRQVLRRHAIDMGFDPCKRCYKNAF